MQNIFVLSVIEASHSNDSVEAFIKITIEEALAIFCFSRAGIFRDKYTILLEQAGNILKKSSNFVIIISYTEQKALHC